MNKFLLRALLVFACAQIAVGQIKVELFDKYAETARMEWKVPGMSIAVVQDGQVLLSKGYGVKELGKNGPVDAETLFGAMTIAGKW